MIKIIFGDKNATNYYLLTSKTGLTERQYDIANIVNEGGSGTYAFVVIANPKDDVLKSAKKSFDTIKTNIVGYTGPRYVNFTDTIKLSASSVTNTSATLSIHLPLASGDFDPAVPVKYTLQSGLDGVAFTDVSDQTLDSKDETAIRPIPQNPTYFRVMVQVSNADVTKGQINRTNLSDEGNAFSEAIAVTKQQIITATKAKYIPIEDALHAGNFTSEFTGNSDWRITCDDSAVYVNNINNKIITYTLSDVPAVKNIKSVLGQLHKNDVITISNNEITYLKLSDSSNYDLGNYAEGAKLDLSLAKNTDEMTVSGTVDNVALSTTGNYHLSDLAVTRKILKVYKDVTKIDLPLVATISFVDSLTVKNVTLNGVELKNLNNSALSKNMTYSKGELTLTENITGIGGINNGITSLKLPEYYDMTISTINGIYISSKKGVASDNQTIKINTSGTTIDLSNAKFSGNKLNVLPNADVEFFVKLDKNYNNETVSDVNIEKGIQLTNNIAVQANDSIGIHCTATNGSDIVKFNADAAVLASKPIVFSSSIQ